MSSHHPSVGSPGQPSHCRYDTDGVTLGVTLMGHDISYVVLGATGTPLLIAEEERYSRRKKGTFIPSPRQVLEILGEVGVDPTDVRHIAIANIPELLENRSVETTNDLPSYGHARCCNALFRQLSIHLRDPESVTWVRHHLCHAASAFLPSPFDTAAILTVDGMGEDETATISIGNGTSIEKRFTIRHPHSLGYLYQAVAQWAGMTGGEREGKLMGLAPLGEPRFLQTFRENLLTTDGERGFLINPALASKRCDNVTWIAHLERLFGPRRSPDGPLTQHHKDVASSVQALTEEALGSLTQLAFRLTGARYACMAGGVFMNSMANGRLRREGPFEDIWVQPMAQDNGLSLGAALWSFTKRHPHVPRWRMSTPFWGSDIIDSQVESIVKEHPGLVQKCTNVEHEAARLIASGKLVGWVQGKCEVGARALGHRSIFADPRDPESKNKLNERIKLREDWRPFAPMVLEEDASLFFLDPRPSPFMTFVAPARNDAPIPAALHQDGTGRLQTVGPNCDPRARRLLQAFKELTGIGLLVNTSFNVRGEPIVRTAEDAYRDFLGCGMDALVVGDYLFEKECLVPQGPPLSAPQPRIMIDPRLIEFVQTGGSTAIVALGSSSFLSEVKKSLREHIMHSSRVEVFESFASVRPPSFPIRIDQIMRFGGNMAISELGDFERLLILSPIWVEVASDLIPNLLVPFVELLMRTSALEVMLADESGGFCSLTDVAKNWERGGPRGPVSEVEHHWLFRR